MQPTPKLLASVFLLFCAFFFSAAFSQPTTPQDWGLKQFSIKDKKLGKISFHVDTVNLNTRAPLLIYINGSGGAPLCILVESNNKAAVFTAFDVDLMVQSAEKYHFVVLDKPGTPFCDTVRVEGEDFSDALKAYKPTEVFTQTLSLDWRIAATSKVISYLISNGYYDDKSTIVAWGVSEGGQVVPPLAVRDKRITHAVSVVGAGLNHLYDDIVQWRIDASTGIMSQQQAQDSIEARLRQIQDIYTNPTAIDKMFAGHTYKRWASFGADVPFESLRKLNIPVYMLVASKDPSSPIYGMDYVPLDFIRLGKSNLTYEVCLGCDHFLNREIFEKGTVEVKELGGEYTQKILHWIEE